LDRKRWAAQVIWRKDCNFLAFSNDSKRC